MAELSKKIGEMNYDGLITDITPKAQVRSAILKQLEAETTLKRGTVLTKEADGKFAILGDESAGEPSAILADDTIVGTDEDIVALVYTAGCFDINKIIVKDEYEIKDTDIDKLRKYGIVFKSAQK